MILSNKQTITTALLVLVAMTGWAQTKTATVTGYSPALKDGTLVLAGVGGSGTVVDTVQAGRFAYTLPVEEFTESTLSFLGDGCPNSYTLIFLCPDVTVKVTGNDCLNPLWKVESPIPEQQTQNRLTDYCRDVRTEGMLMDLANAPREKRDSITIEWMRQQMDILPSLPVDAATIRALLGISETAMIRKDFPYMEQLKEVEKTFAARAPKGFENQLAEIHSYVPAMRACFSRNTTTWPQRISSRPSSTTIRVRPCSSTCGPHGAVPVVQAIKRWRLLKKS